MGVTLRTDGKTYHSAKNQIYRIEVQNVKNRPKAIGSPALEWISDLSGKTARITSIGSHSLMVENYSGIEKYAADCVCLKTRCGIIKAEGANLTLREVRKGALIISGDIRHVELPCTIDS